VDRDVSVKGYIQMLQAAIAQCSAIEDESERFISRDFDEDRKRWILQRSSEYAPLPEDNLAGTPIPLAGGGLLEIFVRIRALPDKKARIISYRIGMIELPKNPNDLLAFRYDRSEGKPGGRGWDDDLNDNPEHPWGHLHVNYTAPGANELRLPTGDLCPVVLIRSMMYWYTGRFVP